MARDRHHHHHHHHHPTAAAAAVDTEKTAAQPTDEATSSLAQRLFALSDLTPPTSRVQLDLVEAAADRKARAASDLVEGAAARARARAMALLAATPAHLFKNGVRIGDNELDRHL